MLTTDDSWLAANQLQASFWVSSPPNWSLMHLKQNTKPQTINVIIITTTTTTIINRDVPIRSQRSVSGLIKAFFNWSVSAILSPILCFTSVVTQMFLLAKLSCSNERSRRLRLSSAEFRPNQTPPAINDSKTQQETVYVIYEHILHFSSLWESLAFCCHLQCTVSHHATASATKPREQKANKGHLLM